MSDSLQPHESQHARPPCPSPSPRVHSNSHPSSRCCHPAISSSVVPFSSCPQSLPASESSNESTLHMRWPEYWSFSFSIIPSKEIPGLISFRIPYFKHERLHILKTSDFLYPRKQGNSGHTEPTFPRCHTQLAAPPLAARVCFSVDHSPHHSLQPLQP